MTSQTPRSHAAASAHRPHLPHPVTGTTDGDIAAHTSPGRANLELFTLGFSALVVSLSQSLLVPVLSTLPERLHTTTGQVEWLLTATLLVGAVAVPIFGRLGDMFGKRRMLLVAIAALTIGSLLTAVTDNMALLIVGRAIQGASLAAVPLGISLLATLMPRERAGSAIALVSAMLGVGGALGLPFAGLVAQHWDFHALFWITSIAGLAAFVGVLTIVPEAPSRSGGRIDLLGSTLLAGAVVTLLLPLAEGSSWGWASWKVWSLLGASAVLIVVFGLAQLRVVDPLVDLSALRRRPIVITNLASVFFGFALFASLIGTASYIEAPTASGYGFGSSLLVGGLSMVPSGVAMLLLAPVAALLVRRIGAPRTLTIGALIVALGWGLRIVAVDALWQVVVGSTIVGIGTGVAYASIPSIINAFTPTHELAAANGLNALFRSLGSSLASAIGGSVLAGNLVVLGGFALPSLTAYRELFALCAGASVLAAVLVLFVPRPPAPGGPASGPGDHASLPVAALPTEAANG